MSPAWPSSQLPPQNPKTSVVVGGGSSSGICVTLPRSRQPSDHSYHLQRSSFLEASETHRYTRGWAPPRTRNPALSPCQPFPSLAPSSLTPSLPARATRHGLTSILSSLDHPDLRKKQQKEHNDRGCHGAPALWQAPWRSVQTSCLIYLPCCTP